MSVFSVLPNCAAWAVETTISLLSQERQVKLLEQHCKKEMLNIWSPTPRVVERERCQENLEKSERVHIFEIIVFSH